MNPFEKKLDKLKKRAEIYSELLNPGASDAAIHKFIQQVKLEVPGSFIEFYKACNGSKDEEAVEVQNMSFLSLKNAYSTKKMFDGILGEKQKEGKFFFWHNDWLPFADNHSYDTLAIDTSGKATGRKGCVLQRSKDLFEGEEMGIVAPDFKTYINDWIKRVEEEQIYSFSEKTEENKNMLIEYVDGEGAYYFEYIDHVQYITDK